MALQVKGTRILMPKLQPGATVDENNDGTLEGTATYHIDESTASRLPKIGDAHPKDNRLFLHRSGKRWLPAEKVEFNGTYFGLAQDPTHAIPAYPGGSGQDPIDTHPQFQTLIGGTPAAPLNGAVFDDDGRFVAFADETNDKYGVTSYIVPNTIIYVSWWTRKKPQLRHRGKIVETSDIPPNIIVPPDAPNFLIIDLPFETVIMGRERFYRITVQLRASGPDGWDEQIYKKP